jgi:hypothetical protein
MDRPTVTLLELRTVYSLRDLYDLIEVYLVNAHNRRVAKQIAEKKAKEDRDW